MNLALFGISFNDSEDVLGVLLIVLMLGVVALAVASPYIYWFRQELKYINIEIDRNKDNKREQARWKRRKKRLLMSLLPGFKYE